MTYVNPATTELVATNDDVKYKKLIYIPFTSITGVTDESYPNYDSTANYNTGDYVILPELKTIYKCSKDSTKNVFPPAHPEVWTDWGFINSYKLLATDEEIGAQTTGTDITIIGDFNQCDTLGIINAYFADLVIEQVDNNDKDVSDETLTRIDSTHYQSDYFIYMGSQTIYKNGNTLTEGTDYTMDYKNHIVVLTDSASNDDEIKADYTKCVRWYDVPGKDIGASTFAEYFYSPATQRTRVVETNLDWLPSSFIRLTFTGVEDSAGNHTTKIGTIVAGPKQDMGVTLMGTQLSFSDKSVISNNPINGYRKITRYGHIRELNAKLSFDVLRYSEIANKINNIVGKNVLFIPTECDSYTEMIDLGYVSSAKLPTQNAKLTQAQITIIGVA